ncbi:MAG: hypothetical protein QM669_03740 [Siphonobacter sp.]
MPSKPLIDIVVNAYGKPLMTAVAISSLLKHSGTWINKIYLIEEKKQPYPSDFIFITNHFKGKIIHYNPRFYFGLRQARRSLLWYKPYRFSIRYQYAFEKSKSPYLFVMHNDMLFHGDILGEYLTHIKEKSYAGVGPIGMCWNCSAFYAKRCTPERYEHFRPSIDEFNELNQTYNPPRKSVYHVYQDMNNDPWPLPECRLNEWSALIDLKQTSAHHYPKSKGVMFGQMHLDIATQWFHELNRKGLKFKHVELGSLATHVWTGLEGEVNSGFSTQNDQILYKRAEDMSYEILINHFGFTPSELRKVASVKMFIIE